MISSEVSKVDVFQNFSIKIMSFQKRLDQSYHSEKVLWYKLMKAFGEPSIQDLSRDRTPRTTQQLTNHVANRLLDKPENAGSVFANYTSRFDVEQNDIEMCTLV